MRKFLFCLLTCLILFIAFALIYNPQKYISTCFKGISIWAVTVLPSMLPFFFITLLLTNLGIAELFCKKVQKITGFLYNCSGAGAFVQIMSFISGYPVGAKLISELYKEGTISSEEGTKISTFSSTSGPMFIIGSVGVGMFSSNKTGLILFISHILSAIINGVIFRKLKSANKLNNPINSKLKSANLLYDCAYGATLSCLVVGTFIAVFYVFCEIINDFNLLYPFVFLVNLLINDKAKSRAFCTGLIECTNGAILLSKTNGVLTLPLTAFILAFGGVSILLQSIAFLKEAKVNIKIFILSKLTQAITAFISCFILIKIF